ncbi:MAG: hypothetical protein UT13_C0001G0422 [Candidatus Pacebacteria bacterium GW2011_GWF2_38_9]|nr:MAG: hypothetical protein US01_C0001G0433 [candidate division TM6 bacterium GW2011_GWF2_28_16]KKQ08519.1 MAG: hypothetical protein US20_C0015G0007 [Candidatus Pacebacteria bacterium GW2011_GWF1_36_5]KKQ88775.1 MAG: hypothetical protein UT13_C0001G0422 [Candidatus Pacebacteria bacterium GW2011_GWF2_38_9]HAZ73285.1 hypothetical protein [Candidatus Paceibacterota bacterium]
MQKILSLFSHPLVKKLDRELEKVFSGVPHLPKKATEILVKIAPYLVLVSGLFMITGGLRSIFGAEDFHRIFNLWRTVPSVYFYITGLLQILAGAISLMAYKPLMNRKIEGWYILFCLSILELVMNLVSVIFFRNGLFGLLFSLLISFYVLYEVKSEYAVAKIISKNKSKAKKK